MVIENILMDAVKRGGDRQALHEKLRVYSQQAGQAVKEEGRENPLISMVCSDPAFGVKEEELRQVLDPSRYVGRAPAQVEEFLTGVIQPLLDAHKEDLSQRSQLSI